ncbi:hypothetical protein LTR78_003984 [Recurvomyces mirabilis]|uniref:Uncharacterized protein n=1 Tax=Recurvomyces mirabilis TaxID=574656 RepID=A0AAE0WQP3_9PEZI|nr:hypothetical protein LTR78_003984 [Recurvomyces mirabilis]KAK5153878.1 hypothetical protein LTS14_007098 [Recurvomyces mirabilis]
MDAWPQEIRVTRSEDDVTKCDVSLKVLRHEAIQGKLYKICALQNSDLPALWLIAKQKANQSLLEKFTASRDATLDELRIVIGREGQDSEKIFFTFRDALNNDLRGWGYISMPSNHAELKSTMFFSEQSRRVDLGVASMFLVCRSAFKCDGYTSVVGESGQYELESGYGVLQGIGLPEIPRRRYWDKVRSTTTDLYLIPRTEWPGIRAGMEAWLGSFGEKNLSEK